MYSYSVMLTHIIHIFFCASSSSKRITWICCILSSLLLQISSFVRLLVSAMNGRTCFCGLPFALLPSVIHAACLGQISLMRTCRLAVVTIISGRFIYFCRSCTKEAWNGMWFVFKIYSVWLKVSKFAGLCDALQGRKEGGDVIPFPPFLKSTALNQKLFTRLKVFFCSRSNLLCFTILQVQSTKSEVNEMRYDLSSLSSSCTVWCATLEVWRKRLSAYLYLLALQRY